jgi:hypothetical protein
VQSPGRNASHGPKVNTDAAAPTARPESCYGPRVHVMAATAPPWNRERVNQTGVIRYGP